MISSALQYQIVNAQTGINYQQPTMSIKQGRADLSIQQPKAEITMDLRPGKLSIDQTEAFAAMDRKGPLRRADDFIASALADFSSGVKKRAQQGDQLMRIENGGGAIAAIAKQNGTPPMKQMAIGFIPNSPFDVKVDYQPSQLNIDVQKRDPIIQSSINRPQIDIPRWSASTHMEQMPSIDFEYIGQLINLNG